MATNFNYKDFVFDLIEDYLRENADLYSGVYEDVMELSEAVSEDIFSNNPDDDKFYKRVSQDEAYNRFYADPEAVLYGLEFFEFTLSEVMLEIFAGHYGWSDIDYYTVMSLIGDVEAVDIVADVVEKLIKDGILSFV